MKLSNKEILQQANAAVTRGDHEGFLACCTDDTEWTFVGDTILQGKDAVREYLKVAYATPPQFMVEQLIEEGEFVTAVGKIRLAEPDGTMTDYEYCDVWRLRDGRLHALKAYVIKIA